MTKLDEIILSDERVVALVKAAKAVLWVGACSCDAFYLARKIHDPTKYCGWMDKLEQSLRPLDLEEIKQRLEGM